MGVKAVTKQGYSHFKSMQGGLLLSFAMHNFKHRSSQTRTIRPANSCCFLFYLSTMQVLDWSQRIQPRHRQHSSAPSLGQPSGSEIVFGPSCLGGKSFCSRGFYSVLCDLWDDLLGSWQGSSAFLPFPLVGTWEGQAATGALRLVLCCLLQTCNWAFWALSGLIH